MHVHRRWRCTRFQHRRVSNCSLVASGYRDVVCGQHFQQEKLRSVLLDVRVPMVKWVVWTILVAVRCVVHSTCSG